MTPSLERMLKKIASANPTLVALQHSTERQSEEQH